MSLSEEIYKRMLDAKIPSSILSLLRQLAMAKHSYVVNYLLQALRIKIEKLQVNVDSFDVVLYVPVLLDLLDEVWLVLEETGFSISEVITQREYMKNKKNRRNMVMLDMDVRARIVDLVLSRLSGHITRESLTGRSVYAAGLGNKTLYVYGKPVLTMLDTTYRKELISVIRDNLLKFPQWGDEV